MNDSNVIETPRATAIRLVTAVGRDDKVALAAVQALMDILVSAGVCSADDFYHAISGRLSDMLK